MKLLLLPAAGGPLLRVGDRIQYPVARENYRQAARVIDMRMRDDDRMQRLVEVGPLREECVEISRQFVRPTEVLVFLSAGIDQDRRTGEFDQSRSALAYVNEVYGACFARTPLAQA